MEINDDVPPHSDGTLFQEVGPKHLFKSCVNPEVRSVHDRKTSATKRDAEKIRYSRLPSIFSLAAISSPQRAPCHNRAPA